MHNNDVHCMTYMIRRTMYVVHLISYHRRVRRAYVVRQNKYYTLLHFFALHDIYIYNFYFMYNLLLVRSIMSTYIYILYNSFLVKYCIISYSNPTFYNPTLTKQTEAVDYQSRSTYN